MPVKEESVKLCKLNMEGFSFPFFFLQNSGKGNPFHDTSLLLITPETDYTLA